ncbi:NAD(P)/FAD-dependent oxidoreductase [Arenibaculum sp.]|uniref:NAD(P)/FAD-dependent oxidoreductase n=1 Tax=Arenibaculum sp. TaxID=2865862 RepID=UPI002E15C143|nr:NAD(P)/FAD-dependent oxidoreductase [Arenibaculum sp.]
MWDVVVCGGGPAGAVASHQLARAGHRVLLADRIDPDAHKVGEALPGAAARLLRALGLPVPPGDGGHAPIGGNLSAWGADAPVATDFLRDPDGPGWRLDRRRFDAELRSAAAAAGAGLRTAHLVELAREGREWRIGFDDGGTVRARWLVDATGRRAAVARKLGAVRHRDARLVAVYALGKASPAFRANRTLIEAVPRGWWYAARLPSGDAVAGFHTDPRDAVPLVRDHEAWEQALAQSRHVFALMGGTRFDRPLGATEACGARLNEVLGDGWVACGDAAQSFDPVSAQGILSALHGGMKAAELVRAALEGAAPDRDAYRAQLDRIRRTYLARRLAAYRSERRWPEERFWTRHGAGKADARI